MAAVYFLLLVKSSSQHLKEISIAGIVGHIKENMLPLLVGRRSNASVDWKPLPFSREKGTGKLASIPAIRYLKERMVKFQCTTRLAESAVYSIIMIYSWVIHLNYAGNYRSKKVLDQLYIGT